MSGEISSISGARVSKTNIAHLENKLEQVKGEQGIFGKTWNGIKEISGLGTSEKKCETMLEKYEDGEVSFDEAMEYLNKFESKQENTTELAKNILTGVGAIAVATTTAGTGLGFVAAAQAGAPIGAAIKTTLGVADRATNDVKDDALNAKNIAKDTISGAITGMTSAVSSGVGKGIVNGEVKTSIANGAKCGLACGAISGSTSYMTNVALDDDKKFNFGDLTKATATSALVSGTVGAAVGGGMYANAASKGIVGKSVEKTVSETIVQDSTTSSLRKILGKGVRDVASSVA